ncbi:MAG TPA: DinB family protein [Candidatus Deferrimicrobiaceae bacterium]|nr:DinB family protein [Candidatus Deferrimicrobiaceae bacterium]
MDARDLLLDEHGRMHAAAVTGDKTTLAERTFGGLSDEQMRVRPREDLNSLAWLMWHIARAEDIFANVILSGRDQVMDGGWLARLKTARRDFGIGMSKPEVTELTSQVDVAALREYRDAVGRRTQEIIRGFGPSDWQGELQAPALEKAATLGCFGAKGELVAKAFTGRPRIGVLGGLLVTHAAMHMGEAQTVRTAGGFGSGI